MKKKFIIDLVLYIPFLLCNLIIHGVFGAFEFVKDSHKVFCNYLSKNT